MVIITPIGRRMQRMSKWDWLDEQRRADMAELEKSVVALAELKRRLNELLRERKWETRAAGRREAVEELVDLFLEWHFEQEEPVVVVSVPKMSHPTDCT
jgi:hypothetical protein